MEMLLYIHLHTVTGTGVVSTFESHRMQLVELLTIFWSLFENDPWI